MCSGYMACDLAERPIMPTSIFKSLVGGENFDRSAVPLSDQLGSYRYISDWFHILTLTITIGLSQPIERP